MKWLDLIRRCQGWCVPMARLSLLLALAVGQSAGAREMEPATAPDLSILNVRVYDFAHVPDKEWIEAERIARLVFRDAGIDIALIRCTQESMSAGSPACRSTSGANNLALRIISGALVEMPESQDSIGIALLGHEGNPATVAYIYFSRVEELGWEMARSTTPGTGGMFFGPSWVEKWKSLTLGVAMAHELGHLLLGPRSHAVDGIMSPVWTRDMLVRAWGGQSRFTMVQAGQLRSEVIVRSLGRTSPASAITVVDRMARL